MQITFKILELTDCELMLKWLTLPHIKKFWNDGHTTLEAVRAHYLTNNDNIQRYIFFINQQAAGYVQLYDINYTSEIVKFINPTKHNWGLDIL